VEIADPLLGIQYIAGLVLRQAAVNHQHIAFDLDFQIILADAGHVHSQSNLLGRFPDIRRRQKRVAFFAASNVSLLFLFYVFHGSYLP